MLSVNWVSGAVNLVQALVRVAVANMSRAILDLE